jgi:hypothetical protein
MDAQILNRRREGQPDVGSLKVKAEMVCGCSCIRTSTMAIACDAS